MKVTREQAAANRERILDTATRLFRERGFDGTGVADLMNEAGLTHGGFYGQFASKDALAGETCARSLQRSLERWTRRIGEEGSAGLSAILDAYLSTRHRDDPGSGCTLAALGADVGRGEASIRRSFTDGLAPMLEQVARAMPGRDKARRREAALSTVAAMVGAVVLARAVDDPRLSGEILASTRAALPR